MDTARLFVGCLLDLAATRRVVDAGRALRKALDNAGWRCAWVPPANLHVTLRFLGDVDAGVTPALSAALARVARAHAPLKLCPRGLLALPSPEAPRVLALDFAEGADALSALARAVDDACFELGFPRDPRPFRPHLTLCRVKQPGGALEALAVPRLDAGVALASELTLARSDLTRLGAEHHAVSRHALGDARGPRPEGPRAPRGQSTST
jgi:2'-5' RNA ligase